MKLFGFNLTAWNARKRLHKKAKKIPSLSSYFQRLNTNVDYLRKIFQYSCIVLFSLAALFGIYGVSLFFGWFIFLPALLGFICLLLYFFTTKIYYGSLKMVATVFSLYNTGDDVRLTSDFNLSKEEYVKDVNDKIERAFDDLEPVELFVPVDCYKISAKKNDAVSTDELPMIKYNYREYLVCHIESWLDNSKAFAKYFLKSYYFYHQLASNKNGKLAYYLYKRAVKKNKCKSWYYALVQAKEEYEKYLPYNIRLEIQEVFNEK